MTTEARFTAEKLGLAELDLRWTKPRQKLISSACSSYPEHGHEIGVPLLRGFVERAGSWSHEALVSAWSVESLFAPTNVGKNLQAKPAPRRAREPEPAEPTPPSLGFGTVGGPR